METKITNPVGWFEIYVDDMNRATTFYETILATKLEAMKVPEGMPLEMNSFSGNAEGYGSPGALVKMEGMKAGGNSTIVYFVCEDCAIVEARIEAAGGKIWRPKTSIGEYGFISLVADSEGNTIGLHSMQ